MNTLSIPIERKLDLDKKDAEVISLAISLKLFKPDIEGSNNMEIVGQNLNRTMVYRYSGLGKRKQIQYAFIRNSVALLI